jgi:threonyl-tRNA synthetase
VSEKYNDYATLVSKQLNSYDIRALVDDRNEKVGKKIRDAEMEKMPYMLIVGEDEQAGNTVAVRKRGEGDLGTMGIQDFADKVNNEIKEMLAEI